MLKNLINTFLATVIFALPASASEPFEETISIGKAQRLSIYSKAQQQNRHLLIHLPKNYAETNKPYPVLYLIDGNRHFKHAIISTQLLQQQDRVPEMIIVAISNNEMQHHDPDLGKKKFVHFIKDEVMPYVNKHYRTSGLNTLYGHTKAGWITVELLAEHPELFHNYISVSAPLQFDQVRLYKQISANSKAGKMRDKSLYIALASEAEETKLYSDAFEHFVRLLTEAPPKNLHWRHEWLTNHTHMTTSIPAFYNGMTHVFNSFQAPRFASYQEYNDFGGMQGLADFYKERARIYGTEKNIPEKTLLNLGQLLLDQEQMEQALQLYSILTHDFPESAASYSGLGQVYNAMQQYDKSVKAHQKAVKLAINRSPDWQQSRFQSRLDSAINSAQQASN